MPGRERFKSVSWGVEEACTKEAIEAQFARLAQAGERFFLTYIPVAPHQPFDISDRRFAVFNTSGARLRNDFTGPYLNSLLYMDWVVGGLLDKLDELGLLDRTLVVITGDHGEMVGEEANWAMGGNRPGLVQRSVDRHGPPAAGFTRQSRAGSHVDLLPTHWIGSEFRAAGRALPGVSFSVKAAGDRRVYLSSYHEEP
jgi:arylsulfatase A-like enzyme